MLIKIRKIETSFILYDNLETISSIAMKLNDYGKEKIICQYV